MDLQDTFFKALRECDLNRLRRFQPKLTVADVNTPYIDGKKPIYTLFSVQHSETDMISALNILLNSDGSKRDINFFDSMQNDKFYPSPLKRAIRWKYYKLAKLIIDNTDDPENLQTVLNWDYLKTNKNASDKTYQQSIEESNRTDEEKDIMRYIYEKIANIQNNKLLARKKQYNAKTR